MSGSVQVKAKIFCDLRTKDTSASKSTGGIPDVQWGLLWTQGSLYQPKGGTYQIADGRLGAKPSVGQKVSLLWWSADEGKSPGTAHTGRGSPGPGKPIQVKAAICYRSEGKEFPSASVVALKGKVSWKSQPRTTMKSHSTTEFTQEIDWERHKRMTVSARVRSSRERSRRQA